jgi:hypothetical protein
MRKLQALWKHDLPPPHTPRRRGGRLPLGAIDLDPAEQARHAGGIQSPCLNAPHYQRNLGQMVSKPTAQFIVTLVGQQAFNRRVDIKFRTLRASPCGMAVATLGGVHSVDVANVGKMQMAPRTREISPNLLRCVRPSLAPHVTCRNAPKCLQLSLKRK